MKLADGRDLITTLDEWKVNPDYMKLMTLAEEGEPVQSSPPSEQYPHGEWSSVWVKHPVHERFDRKEWPGDIKVLDEWRDDRVQCYAVAFVYPDETYVVSFWWCGSQWPYRLMQWLDKRDDQFFVALRDSSPDYEGEPGAPLDP